MASYKIEDTTLTNIADAIRSKTGGTATIRVDKMASAIESLAESPTVSIRTNSGVVELENLTDLTANGLSVTQLLLNGVAIWGEGSLSYTNLVNVATTEPGGTALYNGIGYRDGSRWSSSSKVVKDDVAQGRVSGWMPYTPNAICRIQGFNLAGNNIANMYVTNFYMVGCKEDGTIGTHTYALSKNTEYDTAKDIATFTTPVDAYKYFRISAYVGDVTPPVVTINEEIA